MTILYGVKRNPADTGSCADTYLNASQMVGRRLEQCLLDLTDRNVHQSLNHGPTPIVIKRVIAAMNTAGVNT